MEAKGFCLGRAFCVAVVGVLLVLGVTPALGAPFTVNDSDFEDGVYELRYYTATNLLVKNGVATPLSLSPLDALFLTNTGNTADPAWSYYGADSGVRYLQALYPHGPTVNTSASATMGWDLSGVSEQIAAVELLTRHVMFQFSPWHMHALGDAIYAQVATPSSFGDGPYETIYHLISDNADGTGPGAIEAGGVDVTSVLSPEWLGDPTLLELKFGYELQNTDIPGRHVQLFRDNYGEFPENQGFMLRITLVPEPATLGLLALGGLAMLRRRTRRV